jgi:transposase
MRKTIKTIIEKEAIITEYLTEEISFRELGRKYGINFRKIHLWVMEYQGKKYNSATNPKKEETDDTALPQDVKQLQAELRRMQLQNKLLNAMIDIAEEQLKIDIRKKSGTRQ